MIPVFGCTGEGGLHPPHHGVPIKAPVRVLLVGADALRQLAWKRAIKAIDQGLQVECYAAFSEAMLRCTRLGPHCLMVDAEADSVLGAAVQRFLARCAPQAHVLWLGSVQAACASSAALVLGELKDRLTEFRRHLPRNVH